MTAVLYSELLTAARTQVDERSAGTDAFCTDLEGCRHVNRAVEAFRGEMVLAGGRNWFTTQQSPNPVTVVGTATVALPADHYETVAVQLAWTATDIEEVRGWEWAEHAPGKALTWAMHGPKGYRIIGGNLLFVPTPTSVVTIHHWYVSGYTLGTSTSTFDGLVDGWRDCVELDVAVRICRMNGTEFLGLARELETTRVAALERCQRLLRERAVREPPRIADVAPEERFRTGRRRWWPTGGY